MEIWDPKLANTKKRTTVTPFAAYVSFLKFSSLESYISMRLQRTEKDYWQIIHCIFTEWDLINHPVKLIPGANVLFE